MRRALLLIAAFFATCACAFAQAAPGQSTQPAPAASAEPAPTAASAPSEPLTQWRSGLIEIDDGWAEHDGDNLAWAATAFDSSAWPAVDLEDMGPARGGWRWYRKRVVVGPDYPEVRVLLEGGVGVYELYVNGQRIDGAELNSPFNVRRPVERVFTLESDSGDYLIAIRTRVPPSYTVYHLPLFLSVTMGQRTVIGYERRALESARLYYIFPSVSINLLLVLAGLALLALFGSQRAHREYLYLGLYLLCVGISDGIWIPHQAGMFPTSANLLFADPLIFICTVAQIHFTFSFAGRKPGPFWRIYTIVLLLAPLLAYSDWVWHWLGHSYDLIEALLSAPAAILLPIMLWTWYRRGNREAAWLIVPSIFPAAATVLFNLGTASFSLGWRVLDFLVDPIPIGTTAIQLADLSSLLFLVAVAVVMFFRFTRVSREQAHSAAELEAARLVQERLISAAPEVPGFSIASVYLPAQQVGGDFFRVRAEDDGVLIVIGDVSGKGLGAAMTVSAIVGALRAMPKLSPASILAALNRGLAGNMSGGFVTCLALHVGADGLATVANAGHLAPYRNGDEIPLETGLPLGIVEAVDYAETRLTLAPGDTLTLITDGVIEAQSAAGELFGFERAAAISAQPAGQIAKAAEQFGQEDDITVLTLTRLLTTTKTKQIATPPAPPDSVKP